MTAFAPPLRSTPWTQNNPALSLLLTCLFFVMLTGFGPFRRAEQTAQQQLNQAQSQLADDNTEAAIQTLRSLRLSNQDTDAGYEGTALLGVLLLEGGDTQGALQAAKGVLQAPEAPTSAQNTAHFVAGLALYAQGKFKKAEGHLTPLEGIVTDPADVYHLAKAMVDLSRRNGNNYERAKWLIYLERVAPAQEVDIYRNDLQAIILSALSEKELAQLGKIAGRMYPNDYILFSQAKQSFSKGDYQTTIQKLKLFSTNYPNHPLKDSQDLLLLRAEQGGALEPHLVGVILPLSGRFAAPAKAVKRGIELASQNAVAPRWAPGGIKFIFRDTEGDPEKAAQAVRDLTLDKNVIAIIGPLVSAEAEVAATMAQDLEIPIITLTQREGIPDIGAYVFRAFPSVDKQLAHLTRYVAKEMGISRVAILYPENSYGTHSADLFWSNAEDHGLKIAAVEAYKPGTENFIPTAKKLSQKFYPGLRRSEIGAARAALKADSDPSNDKDPIELSPIIDFEALYIPDSFRTTNLIAPALAYVEIPVGRFTVNRGDKPIRLLGGNTWNNPEFPRIGGDYVVGSIFVADYFAKADTPGAQNFAKAYKKSYGKKPETFSAHGFDAASLVLFHLGQEEPRSRHGFTTRIAEGTGFEGATGTLRFDESGDLDREAYILTISRRGNIVQLYPATEPKK